MITSYDFKKKKTMIKQPVRKGSQKQLEEAKHNLRDRIYFSITVQRSF